MCIRDRGDAVCLNDPITGQGSNNAAKAAAVYLKRILDHGDRPFDEAWMQGTFNPVSYTHLDVYKRQSTDSPPPTPFGVIFSFFG